MDTYNYKLTFIFVFPFLYSCTSYIDTTSSTNQVTHIQNQCEATQLEVNFISEPTIFWKTKLQKSAQAANTIISSKEFLDRCNASKLRNTNGKFVPQVCQEIICAGKRNVNFEFYNSSNSRAIAYEKNNIVYINTAHQNAGTPGNIVHEFTHTLGYKHFTNWPFLSKNSVPYTIGNLVDNMSQ